MKTRSPAWVRRLMEWFDQARRAMPWRRRPTPYRVWISEIMLQQTQVETVRPYFLRFTRQFPTIAALAEADTEDVLKAWEGLGYYARARNLHRAAQTVMADHDGRLPTTAGELKRLPGIGDYTAAAVSSICFHEPVPVVDGNVLRVFTRFWGIESDIARPRTKRELAERLCSCVDRRRPGDFNQAAMELGALVCRPYNPDCRQCPLRRTCAARKTGRTADLPVKSRRPSIPHYDVAVGVVRKDGRILVARRKETQMLGGLWEFPGGKRKGDEPLEKTVRREVREEAGIVVSVGDLLRTVEHAYSHFRITLHAFECRLVTGQPHPLQSAEVRWTPASCLQELPFPAANREIIRMLLTHREKDGQPDRG